jgi:UDP-N-acetylglucosamine 2-epimerase (non-hydrolysing)
MKLTLVAGARPNFIKIAPIINAINIKRANGIPVEFRLVHTGQHFDSSMSGTFFSQLGIPTPHVNLASGGGSQAEQTATILIGFEKELLSHRPDMVIVVGDVTSTMAATVTAKKLNIPVAHVEAGIRSGDLSMPEEINRLITDSICDEYYTTTQMASDNLLNCHTDKEKIHFVGNTMIDTLYKHLSDSRPPDFWNVLNLKKNNYLLLTLHRPSNVDNVSKLESILTVLEQNTHGLPIIFPVHPRTKQRISAISFFYPGLKSTDPLGYFEFIYLLRYAKGIVTDSGGVTEEATVLNIPCITLRDSTERPETVLLGTNVLVGDDLFLLQENIDLMVNGKWKQSSIPDFWDGHAAERIIDSILEKHMVHELV